jgi:hypothetical protein
VTYVCITVLATEYIYIYIHTHTHTHAWEGKIFEHFLKRIVYEGYYNRWYIRICVHVRYMRGITTYMCMYVYVYKEYVLQRMG